MVQHVFLFFFVFHCKFRFYSAQTGVVSLLSATRCFSHVLISKHWDHFSHGSISVMAYLCVCVCVLTHLCWNDKRCGKCCSGSGDEKPLWDAEAVVTFSQRSGVRSKTWTMFLEQQSPGSGFVYGSGGENKASDCLWPEKWRGRGGRDSVSCVGNVGPRILPGFHPLASSCCIKEIFHPLAEPEATVPLRPVLPCDPSGVLRCSGLISWPHWWMGNGKEGCLRLPVVCFVLHLSRVDLEHSSLKREKWFINAVALVWLLFWPVCYLCCVVRDDNISSFHKKRPSKNSGHWECVLTSAV